MKKRHEYTLALLAEELNTDFESGLSSAEASSRYEAVKKRTKGREYSLFVAEKRGIFHGVLSFLSNPALILLLFISFFCALFGRDLANILIFCISLAFAVIGSYLSAKASDRLDAMRSYSSPMVLVKRSGRLYVTDGRNIVVGDVIILKKGDLLPCDARIIESYDLVVDEIKAKNRGVTRQRVSKCAIDGLEEGVSQYSDAENMLFAGSAVVCGTAVAVVTEIGEDVLLAADLPSGALAGSDGYPRGAIHAESLFFKINLVTSLLLIVLSLVSIITLNGVSSLSSTVLILLTLAVSVSYGMFLWFGKVIFTKYISRASRRKASKKAADGYAAIKNYKALDALSEITDVIMLGSAGVLQGEYKLDGVFALEEMLPSLSPDRDSDSKILSMIHNFRVACNKSRYNDTYYNDGISAAIDNYLDSCGFDAEGSKLVIQSAAFDKDRRSGFDFAYIETNTEFLKIGLVRQINVLKICDHIRTTRGIEILTESQMKAIVNYINYRISADSDFAILVSEQDNKTVFEAVLSFGRSADVNFNDAINKLKRLGINTKLMTEDCSGSFLNNNKDLLSATGESIARASSVLSVNDEIAENYNKYNIFVGFDKQFCIDLIKRMKSEGSKVAILALDDQYNDVMALADVAVSFDTINFGSEKHRQSLYESLPTEGSDKDIRASQQTRLLSKVIVRRANAKGGGLTALYNAVKTSRAAYISFTAALYLMAMLISAPVAFTFMSFLTGSVLINPFETALLLFTFAMLSLSIFADPERTYSEVSVRRDYTVYPLLTLKSSLPEIIARAVAAAVLAIALKILDVLGVFSGSVSHELPIYICLLITVFIEVFSVNRKFDGKGKRKCWHKVLLAYAILLSYLAITTQSFFVNVVPDIRLLYELLIIPAYIVLYFIAVLIAHFVSKKRKI